MVFLWILIPVFCLVLLYLLLLTPRARRPEAEPLACARYAHRGLWDGTHPENSLSAFRLAVENGFGIELDVQLSRDGEVMVFHDESLSRMTGVDGSLYDKSREELAALSLAGTSEGIPTLAEVLSLVCGRVPLLIEIKSDHDYRGVCEKTAALLDAYTGAYTVESFHPLAVSWFRQNRPSVVRGQLSARLLKQKETRKPSHFIVQYLLLNFLARPDFIAYDLHDTGVLSFRLMRLFRPYTVAWTVRTEEELRAARRFDGVIFEGEAGKALREKMRKNENEEA